MFRAHSETGVGVTEVVCDTGRVRYRYSNLTETGRHVFYKQLYLREQVQLSDTLYKTPRVKLTEQVQLVDTVHKTPRKKLSEQLTLQDTLHKTPRKRLSEQVRLVDSVKKTVRKQLVETIQLVDSVTRRLIRVVVEVALTRVLPKVKWIRKQLKVMLKRKVERLG